MVPCNPEQAASFWSFFPLRTGRSVYKIQVLTVRAGGGKKGKETGFAFLEVFLCVLARLRVTLVCSVKRSWRRRVKMEQIFISCFANRNYEGDDDSGEACPRQKGDRGYGERANWGHTS